MKLSLLALSPMLRRVPALLASLELQGSLHRGAHRQPALNAGIWVLLLVGVVAVGLAFSQGFKLLLIPTNS